MAITGKNADQFWYDEYSSIDSAVYERDLMIRRMAADLGKQINFRAKDEEEFFKMAMRQATTSGALSSNEFESSSNRKTSGGSKEDRLNMDAIYGLIKNLRNDIDFLEDSSQANQANIAATSFDLGEKINAIVAAIDEKVRDFEGKLELKLAAFEKNMETRLNEMAYRVEIANTDFGKF